MTKRASKPMYLIVPGDASPYVLRGRVTVAIKDKLGCSPNKLFKIEDGVASQLTMRGHFTEKDPWSWAEVPQQTFIAMRETHHEDEHRTGD